MRAQAIGPEFRVSSYTTGTQYRPSAAAAADGRFVVTWESREQDGSYQGVFGQRYDSNGSPAGPEFRVNSFTTSTQYEHSVAASADGRFIATWASTGQDGSSNGVFGQRYDPGGLPLGPEFPVNSTTQGEQRRPSVVAAADGRFLVVWQCADGSGFGVIGRRFQLDVVFADGFQGG